MDVRVLGISCQMGQPLIFSIVDGNLFIRWKVQECHLVFFRVSMQIMQYNFLKDTYHLQTGLPEYGHVQSATHDAGISDAESMRNSQMSFDLTTHRLPVWCTNLATGISAFSVEFD